MERYVYIGEKEMCKTSFPKNGVFWIIEGKLLAFAFEEEIYPRGLQSLEQPIIIKTVESRSSERLR